MNKKEYKRRINLLKEDFGFSTQEAKRYIEEIEGEKEE